MPTNHQPPTFYLYALLETFMDRIPQLIHAEVGMECVEVHGVCVYDFMWYKIGVLL